MIREIFRKAIDKIRAEPGDLIRVTYTDKQGIEHQLADTPIDVSCEIDTVVIVKLEGEHAVQFGMSECLGALLGK